MNKKEWRNRIERATREAGTYQPFFEDVIDTLAGIMEMKDAATEQYEKDGGKPIVDYVNRGGHSNPKKNPALAVINECNQQALAYWRDLGLSPAGYKRLTGKEVKDKEETRFEDVLANIGI